MSDPEVASPVPAPERERAAGPPPSPGVRRPETEPAPARPRGPDETPGRRLLAEIYITPLGTGEASIREHIRALRPLLDASGLRWEQTPLGTLVEGELVPVLELTRALHEMTFLAGPGARRVVTHLRIDERRDGDPRL